MKHYLMLLFMVILITGCSMGNTAKGEAVNNTNNVKTVTIRSGSAVTKYKVNNENLIVKSTYENTYGAINTRTYSYDDNKELNTIEKNNSITGTELITISSVKNRSTNKVTQKVKTMPGSRGETKTLIVDYYYDDNGKVIGMVQKDSNGNIIAKGINN
ncbi:MAG: hypothetical protein A2015_10930 [Spirochaetes bacterium GWF1_31_7]|nr:MAG: hypothetical protein A2Y30_13065 [Spirochaetes bacterium GWE1_32_154]OHD48371.1 MAG: hypothetical protein A2015_10930 [Spirochaetes bacterium GWF1_31_7]OHD50464.1 MAG: hypothetical protein A2Y29_11110 [Spirochaetes bacterium GWE2_31_10]OHD82667.1 MAG: hypothetical protein A2355_15210 [Spirochaetes bacterium RIFOXYB1_FULL_32_8]HBD93223.1 hypothetical protein [Spirochaetia bacterium]